jgi:hypothetical protein
MSFSGLMVIESLDDESLSFTENYCCMLRFSALLLISPNVGFYKLQLFGVLSFFIISLHDLKGLPYMSKEPLMLSFYCASLGALLAWPFLILRKKF